jgi:O-antigen/teichoic acid export membrane protein
VLRNDPALARILKNSGWLLSAKGASLPIGVAQSVLVARLLGVDGFGTLGVVATYVATARRLASFRMDEVVVKFVTDALVIRKDHRLAAATIKLALLAELVGSIIALGLIWLSVPLVGRFFLGESVAVQFIYLYALTLVTDAVLESTTGALQVFGLYRVQAIADVVGKVVTLLGVVVAFVLERGLSAVVIAYLVGNAVTTAILVWAAIGEARSRLGAGWWRTPLGLLGPTRRELAKFALSTNLGATLSLVVKDSELLWLSYFTSPASAGYYRLAKSWISMVVIPAGPLVKSFYPEIARTIAASDVASTRRLLRRGSLLAAVWIVPVGLACLAAAPLAVPWAYGAAFQPAIGAFALLLLGVGVADIVFWMRPALLALGRPDVALRISALHTVLKIGLVITLVPIGGHLAMAGITGGLFILGTVLGGTFVLRRLAQQGRETLESTTAGEQGP